MPDKQWRPKDFNASDIRKRTWEMAAKYWSVDYEVALVEAGADAMLEELKKSAGIELDRPDILPEYYKKGEDEEIWFQPPANGWLVFIPDEEERNAD